MRLLRPEVAFPLAYLLFLLLAMGSYASPVTSQYLRFASPGALPVLLTLAGVGLFILGAVLAERSERTADERLLLGAIAFLSFYVLHQEFPGYLLLAAAAASGSVLLWLGITRFASPGMIALSSSALALLALGYTLSRGVPLFEPVLREQVAVSPERAIFHGLGVVGSSMMLVSMPLRISLPLVSLLVAGGVLAGFKSDAIAIALSSCAAALLTKRLSVHALLLAVAFALLVLTLVSTHIAGTAYGTWSIPPWYYPLYRAGFTFLVFSSSVQLAFPLGLLHGRALLDVSQTIASVAVLGYTQEHIITTTFFGPAVLDFGLAGVLIAVPAGAYLGLMYRLSRSPAGAACYAAALVHMLILIEVGVQPTSVLFLLMLLYLSQRAQRR
ncbi:MAG: hypothetical protein GXN98_01275 [Euryarchaeota archaeon]|nr:hypothetical protein [Euryarchaeota archaeon]